MNDKEIYANVTRRNDRYDKVDAIAEVKGHIETQDLEEIELGSEEELNNKEEQCRELE